MYGQSSLMVYNPQARLVYSTDSRTINTPEQLKAFVDSFPDRVTTEDRHDRWEKET